MGRSRPRYSALARALAERFPSPARHPHKGDQKAMEFASEDDQIFAPRCFAWSTCHRRAGRSTTSPPT